MPNLTGDFDLVVEFSVLAANRVLAAMHSNSRFLHSLSLRVDDNPPPGTKVPRPSIGGSIDIFGDAVPNQRRIGLPPAFPGPATAAIPRLSVPDTVVNAAVGGVYIPPVVPSKLQGRAQLQLSPPSLDVPDASGANLRVSLQVMSRYLPDPKTSAAAEFIRGQLQITAPVDQFTSKAANVIEIDIRSDQVLTNFSPLWTSRNLSAEDLAGINLLIRNALRTGFLPSSSPLPPNIDYAQFKTFVGNPSAIGVLLNMASFDPTTGRHIDPQENPGNPSTVNQNVLAPRDDFAIAISADFILSKIQFSPIANRSVPLYHLSFQLPTVEFQEGQILVKIRGHAEGSHWYSPPAFDFTATQAFAFNLVSTTGGPLNTAELVAVGDVSIDPPGIGWLVDLFEGGDIRQQRDNNLRDMQPSIRAAMDINSNLGDFLSSILKPPDQTPPLPPGPNLALAYIPPVKIHAGGIVLHGPMTVPDWPPAHVEFQEIPVSIHGPLGGLVGAGPDIGGPDYSALNTWIPGGTIQQYEWYHLGDVQPYIDANRFVLLHSPQASTTAAAARTRRPFAPPGVATTGAVSGYGPLCLTVRGARISASGPELMQPVSSSLCGFTTFPVVSEAAVAQAKTAPMIALVQEGPQGSVHVAGHAPALTGANGDGVPNVILHFAGEKSASRLDVLTQALRDSGRNDAVTAVVVAFRPAQLSKARHFPGIVYADDYGDAWRELYGVKFAPPATLIVSPTGNVVWHHEGELDAATLTAALRKFLTRGGATAVRVPRLGLRNGATPPNLAFPYAPRRPLTLAKVRGPGILVFCTSLSGPSLEAVRDAQGIAEKSGMLVLAIYVGETPEAANRSAAANGFSAIVVPDPDRSITRAYGVSYWPITVILDKDGLVRQVRYGRGAAEQPLPYSGKSSAAK